MPKKPSLVETKPLRTMQEIEQEYNNTCARAGHLQYTILSNTHELAEVNAKLKELNLEAAAAKAAEGKSNV